MVLYGYLAREQKNQQRNGVVIASSSIHGWIVLMIFCHLEWTSEHSKCVVFHVLFRSFVVFVSFFLDSLHHLSIAFKMFYTISVSIFFFSLVMCLRICACLMRFSVFWNRLRVYHTKLPLMPVGLRPTHIPIRFHDPPSLPDDRPEECAVVQVELILLVSQILIECPVDLKYLF